MSSLDKLVGFFCKNEKQAHISHIVDIQHVPPNDGKYSSRCFERSFSCQQFIHPSLIRTAAPQAGRGSACQGLSRPSSGHRRGSPSTDCRPFAGHASTNTHPRAHNHTWVAVHLPVMHILGNAGGNPSAPRKAAQAQGEHANSMQEARIRNRTPRLCTVRRRCQ